MNEYNQKFLKHVMKLELILKQQVIV